MLRVNLPRVHLPRGFGVAPALLPLPFVRRWVLRGGSLVIIAFNKFEKIKHFNLHILGFKGDPVLDGLFGSQKPNDFSLVWLDSNKMDEMGQLLNQEYPVAQLLNQEYPESWLDSNSEARSDESQDSRCGSITTSTAPPSCTVSSVRVTAPQSCVVSASGTPSTAPLSRTLSSLHSDISDRWSEAMSDESQNSRCGSPIIPMSCAEIIVPSDPEERRLLRSELKKKTQSRRKTTPQFSDSDQDDDSIDDSDRDQTYNPDKETDLNDSDKGSPTKRKKHENPPSEPMFTDDEDENENENVTVNYNEELYRDISNSPKSNKYKHKHNYASDEQKIYQIEVESGTGKDLSHNKLQICTFCPDLKPKFSNFARHLFDVHKMEDEVVTLSKYPSKHKVRMRLISLLRIRGNHELNMDTLRKKEGMFVPQKRVSPGKSWRVEDFSPCPNCHVWLVSRLLWKHQKQCTVLVQSLFERKRSEMPRVNERELALQSALVAGRICLQASEDLKKEVFVSMKNDVISKVAKGDPLIVALGNLSMKRNIGNKVMRRYNVSSDMRLAARCLIELRELQEGEDAQKNLTWYDGLHPDQYDNIVKAVFAVCRENFNEAEGEDDDDRDDLEAPSNAIKLSYDIARLCNVKVTRCIVEGDNVLAEKTRKETKRFMEMFKYNWSTDVKKRARHVLRERKLNQKVELPDPIDIATLANHMKTRMERSVRPETYDEFKELQYNTLARLIAFNRRRPGELQVMRYN